MPRKIRPQAFAKDIARRFDAARSAFGAIGNTEWTRLTCGILNDAARAHGHVHVSRHHPDEVHERKEYLSIDAMWWPASARNKYEYAQPSAAIELENYRGVEKILYCMWKVTVVGVTDVRAVICYPRDDEAANRIRSESHASLARFHPHVTGTLVMLEGRERYTGSLVPWAWTNEDGWTLVRRSRREA